MPVLKNLHDPLHEVLHVLREVPQDADAAKGGLGGERSKKKARDSGNEGQDVKRVQVDAARETSPSCQGSHRMRMQPKRDPRKSILWPAKKNKEPKQQRERGQQKARLRVHVWTQEERGPNPVVRSRELRAADAPTAEPPFAVAGCPRPPPTHAVHRKPPKLHFPKDENKIINPPHLASSTVKTQRSQGFLRCSRTTKTPPKYHPPHFLIDTEWPSRDRGMTIRTDPQLRSISIRAEAPISTNKKMV